MTPDGSGHVNINLPIIDSFFFKECTSLKSVTIGPLVTTIKQYAFSASGLQGTLTIPSTVKTMEAHLFQSCTGITSIVFAPGHTYIPPGLCHFCFKLASVVIPEGVTEIKGGSVAGAFQRCALASVTLPSTLISVGQDTFSTCSSGSSCPANFMTHIKIPAAVRSLGRSAFWGQKALTCVDFEDLSKVTIGDYCFQSSGMKFPYDEASGAIRDNKKGAYCPGQTKSPTTAATKKPTKADTDAPTATPTMAPTESLDSRLAKPSSRRPRSPRAGGTVLPADSPRRARGRCLGASAFRPRARRQAVPAAPLR